MLTENIGIPLAKFAVPSRGSIIHIGPVSFFRSFPLSSAMNEAEGTFCFKKSRIAFSDFKSYSVTKS